MTDNIKMENNNVREFKPHRQRDISKIVKFVLVILILASSAFGGWKWFSKKNAKSGSGNVNIATRTVRRGDLTITVSESGSIRAKNAVEIRSEVDDQVAIISIVPEGTYITQEDVDKGKVLIKLDSSNLQEELENRQMDFDSAIASLVEAKGSYDIQLKQNESDISAAEMKVRFSLMDFRKYMGQEAADMVIADANQMLASDDKICGLLCDPNLGGSALQQLKALNDEIDLAEERYLRAEDKLEWSKKLAAKKYVSQTELKSDELSLKSLKVQKEQAETSLKLFELYEFPKESQRLLSDYYESNREMSRTEASTRSKLAQADARLKNAQARHSAQKLRLEKKKSEVAACTIKAPAPGMVVYATSNSRSSRSEGPVEAGLMVRERQHIMSLPDMSEMVVDIDIHESSVVKVKPGQRTNIIIDAFPDKTFSGKVLNVSLLPDQRSSWLNPDLKVYSTDIGIDGSYEFLRPGMSARVEIIVEHLSDVIIVPVQSVANRRGKKICYVQMPQGPKEVEVETGSFNDIFVQITAGLEVGQEVLLNPPLNMETETAAKSKGSKKPKGLEKPNVPKKTPSLKGEEASESRTK